MPNSSRKTIFTTISIDKETAALVEKICKRYSLKKSEVVKLAFGYIDKAHINPSETPESVKSELAKINKRQDDIIRFIRHYEEEQLNPMIRATNSIALRFDAIGKTLETLILSQLEASQERQTVVLKKLSEQFCNHADVINNQSKQINALYQIHQRDYKKLLHLIQLYSELSACGVMDSKRKESLKAEINNLTKYIATQTGKKNIRCNAVAPGLILTPAALNNLNEEVRKIFLGQCATPYLGEPQDVAATIAFLASEDARYITGQTIVVDGGLTIHNPTINLV
ncbi:ribbon-helix-helix, copG family protein [Bacteroides fragilis str. S6L8]|uniref:SDR family oxidoreductase n=2 Tax=Bacteroides fragilis TaxID=817 RepID=UPI00044C890D|nr:SDR family oxidoreductase [Bacteroides fragilis]EYE45155.1 ribbon-helix-helix, copG family protein [Bacteroides fragilis str. S6L5]EYA03424.1 ribbon-helix-helix, copG family protein [Bacteroides fragilis str. S6L3]EYA07959.1 ribbon-helix-helix, copG family protein [Bacteroides fragilis str. S6R6]EYA99012.1 ribbon-helix-helix, copG family protein [Bacteroides fragilis str. S6L8]EYB03681.1 ribbon-helix-helix, copG family protein [Bacteroides fragilis str. S6R5]